MSLFIHRQYRYIPLLSVFIKVVHQIHGCIPSLARRRPFGKSGPGCIVLRGKGEGEAGCACVRVGERLDTLLQLRVYGRRFEKGSTMVVVMVVWWLWLIRGMERDDMVW